LIFRGHYNITNPEKNEEEIILDFFDKLSDVTKNVAKNVTNKTNDIIEITKLNSKIAAEEGKIKELVMRLGEACLAEFNSGAKLSPAMIEICNAIAEGRARIESINDEVDVIKEVGSVNKNAQATRQEPVELEIKCPGCGALMAPGTKFCGVCGTKLPEPEPVVTEIKCAGCGALITAGTKFCGVCGMKLPDGNADEEE